MARHDDRGTILWTDKKRTFLGLPLSFTRYYLTDHQLITRVGFLSIKEDEIELYRIVDKRIEQTLLQRLFGCGTVIILSRDEDTPEKHLVPFGIRSRFPSSSAILFGSGRKICGSPAEI